MRQFYKLSLDKIPKEAPQGGGFFESPQLKTLEKLASDRLDDITFGNLEVGASFDFHVHKGLDEIAIVVKGNGTFFWSKEEVIYTQGDVFIIPSDTIHKFTNTGQEETNMFFIRFNV